MKTLILAVWLFTGSNSPMVENVELLLTSTEKCDKVATEFIKNVENSVILAFDSLNRTTVVETRYEILYCQ